MKKKLQYVLGLVLISLLVVGNAGAAVEYTITDLGDLPGGDFYSAAYGVSNDGSVVVGEGYSASGYEAFRWTSGGGMVGLGYLDGGSFYSLATGVSADGSLVVGRGRSPSGWEAFRWWSGNGKMEGLGVLPGNLYYSYARDVSGDGSVVVGYTVGALGGEAFRWTSGGMVGLGYLDGGSSFESSARGVNGNGSVVVGGSDGASGWEAFCWTSGGGMVGLGDLSGGGFDSEATGVNAYGSVVVGYGSSASGQEAFRWTSGDMVGLGDLPGGGFDSEAKGVNSDGSVVVGYGSSASGEEAFRWTSGAGMENLNDLVDPTSGWLLGRAYDISDLGHIVGYGTLNNETHAFLLTPVSEQSSLSLTIGWNLMSLPLQPSNTAIESVLSSIASKYASVWVFQNNAWKVYDPANPGFSDLLTMGAGWGYWINMSEAATLSVSGSAPPDSISLVSGWNLVGCNTSNSLDIADALASIEGKYVSVWAFMDGAWKVYDPANPGFSDLATMEPKYGYWVKTIEACTWTLP